MRRDERRQGASAYLGDVGSRRPNLSLLRAVHARLAARYRGAARRRSLLAARAGRGLASIHVDAFHRPAARVLCLDAGGRMLLLRWRDPARGSLVWEPPGGGIEAGESPLAAARRELAEETGLDSGAVLDRSVPVERDFRWNGRRFAGSEHFFVAYFAVAEPELTRAALRADEQLNLDMYAWVPVHEIAGLSDPVEPPGLETILGSLTDS